MSRRICVVAHNSWVDLVDDACDQCPHSRPESVEGGNRKANIGTRS